MLQTPPTKGGDRRRAPVPGACAALGTGTRCL